MLNVNTKDDFIVFGEVFSAVTSVAWRMKAITIKEKIDSRPSGVEVNGMFMAMKHHIHNNAAYMKSSRHVSR